MIAFCVISAIAFSAIVAALVLRALKPVSGTDWRICDGCGQWSNEFGSTAKNPPDTWDGVVRGPRICADCESAGSINRFLAEKGQATPEKK